MKAKLFRPSFVLLAVLAAVLLGSVGFAAAKKIIYFTDTAVPTSGEKAEIAALNAQAAAQYRVVVRNSRKARLRTTPESADYLAGTAIPPNYRDGGVDVGTPIYTAFDPAAPPSPPALPSHQKVFTTSNYVHITNVAGVPSVQLTISGNAVTAAVYRGPDAGS